MVTLPVRFAWELTPTTYLVLFAVLINAVNLGFYLMDRAVVRQALIDTNTLESYIVLGTLFYLVRRAREAGQNWAMPVIWVVGFLVPVFVWAGSELLPATLPAAAAPPPATARDAYPAGAAPCGP